jgi:hypothetical protein
MATRGIEHHGSREGPRSDLLQFVKAQTSPENSAPRPEEILQRAKDLFQAERSMDLRGLIAEKMEDLRRYDVQAMDRVVAILCWGRSGSLLLSSYLDGHEDVMMLPEICGWRLYEFFERYPSLPLHEKLIAYPAFDSTYGRFFDGDFAISPARYYAAVQAILEFYREWPTEFLESRRTFFIFVHIAYALALGRRPASSNPLIVYAQHDSSNRVAAHLVEDFPEAKFVHTVRDPISSCNGMFQFIFGSLAEAFPRTYVLAPYSALACLANQDVPHFRMESRTRTIRFEDLHCDAAETIRDLTAWLDLPYQATLADSTFNGIPYVVKRGGKAWSGARLDQTQRQSSNLSRKDRALLHALFYENFVEWNYPCPKMFGHPIIRCIVFVALFLVPMKTEMIAARAVFKRRIMPALRQGKTWHAIRCLLGIGFCRFQIISLLIPVFFRRFVYGTALLQVDHQSPPQERCDNGARVASGQAGS